MLTIIVGGSPELNHCLHFWHMFLASYIQKKKKKSVVSAINLFFSLITFGYIFYNQQVSCFWS